MKEHFDAGNKWMEESQPAGKEKKSKANKEKAFGNGVIRLLMMIFHFSSGC